jgi:tetratricopeptide (TPR) repeat protein
VLANTRGFTSHVGAVDSERVQALQDAAQALPDSDPRRAQVLAVLASELQHSGEPSRRRRLAAEAIEIARAAGDEAALAHTLSDASWAITAPDTLEQRWQLVDELFDLTQRLDDPRLSFLTAAWRVFTGMEAGNRSQVESAIAVGRAVAASVPHPSLGWAWLVLEAMWSFAQGDLEASEQWAVQAVEAGTAAGEPDALMMFGAQLFAVRYFQGRLGELVERSVQVAGEEDSLAGHRAGAALALIESGREDQAREMLFAEDLQSIPWEQAWSTAMILWTMVCSRLRIVERAGELYELLAPFSGQIAAAPATVFGTVAWALGVLAAMLERYEEAEGHCAAAAEIEQSLGAPLFLARTHAAWARALIARGRPEDLERAQPMLEEAHDTATRLGAGGVTREIVECRAALAADARSALAGDCREAIVE